MSDPDAAAKARLGNFWRRALVGAFLVGLFAWLALRHPETPPAPTGEDALVFRELYALGTLVSVTVWLDAPEQRDAADAALDALARSLDDFDRVWSAWGDGALGTLNRSLEAGQVAAIPEALRPLATRSFRLMAATDGRFDPRVGELVKLWGFDDTAHYRKRPPADVEIAAAREAINAAPRQYDGEAQWGPAPGVAWDFGAIAKGEAIATASRALREAGFGNHILNAGGNLVVSGRRGPRNWRVGIRDPRGDGPTTMIGALETDGAEAVVTSGDYERYFEYEGQRYHHIVDPRTGSPARGLQAVTVVTRDAALADAASTALFVAGPDHWTEVAHSLGIDQALVVDAQGRIHVSPALAPRLTLRPELDVETVTWPADAGSPEAEADAGSPEAEAEALQ